MSKDLRTALERCHNSIMTLLDCVEKSLGEFARADITGRLEIAKVIRDHRKAVCDAWSADLQATYRDVGQYVETCIENQPPLGDLNQVSYLGATSAHAAWAEACQNYDPEPGQQPETVRFVSAAFLGMCRRDDSQPRDKPSLLELRNELGREQSNALRELRQSAIRIPDSERLKRYISHDECAILARQIYEALEQETSDSLRDLFRNLTPLRYGELHARLPEGGQDGLAVARNYCARWQQTGGPRPAGPEVRLGPNSRDSHYDPFSDDEGGYDEFARVPRRTPTYPPPAPPAGWNLRPTQHWRGELRGHLHRLFHASQAHSTHDDLAATEQATSSSIPSNTSDAPTTSPEDLVTICDIADATGITYSTLTSRRLRLPTGQRPLAIKKDEKRRDLYRRGDWDEIIHALRPDA